MTCDWFVRIIRRAQLHAKTYFSDQYKVIALMNQIMTQFNVMTWTKAAKKLDNLQPSKITDVI